MNTELVKLNKDVFSREDYPKIVDTQFSQLVTPTLPTPDETTVDEFFELYNKLFFEIPIDGEIGSHKELIKRSTEYVGETQNTEEIDLLLEEINQLRLELLDARQTIDDLTQ
jgi:hypothetical protein